jgi:bla regulator protein BlaR1
MPWVCLILSNVALALLVAAGAWIVQRCLKRPGLARGLWILALVKLVTPPLVNVPIAASPGPMECALGFCGCEQHPPHIAMVRGTLPLVLLAVWLAGAAATTFSAWRRWIRFQQLLEHASPAPVEWQKLSERVAHELCLKSGPAILTVPGRLPPFVISGRRGARMVLPAELVDQLNPSQRRALLLHEMVHLKRGDHFVRLFELLVRVAFWWLPIVGSIGRQLRACEEACCDAAVVERLPEARRDYARLLLDVLDFADPLPEHRLPQATAMSVAQGLEQRLTAILGSRPPARRRWPAAAVTVMAALALFPCGVHYKTARPIAAASTDDCQRNANAAVSVGSKLDVERVSAMCCPR